MYRAILWPCCLLILPGLPVAASAGPGAAAPLSPLARPAALDDRVAAAHAGLRDAIVAGDVAARMRFYWPDARSLPDYQPALYGAARIAAYHRAMLGRRRVTAYAPVTAEVLDLGDVAVEIGTFTIAWRLADGAAERGQGRYLHVWRAGPDGALRLEAEATSLAHPVPDPAAFVVAAPDAAPPVPPAGTALAAELDAINREIARAVQDHDTEGRLAVFARDATIMPFADATRAGIDAIRPYLTAYVDAGRGAVFDSVRVWNTGFRDFGGYVLEYPKFRVAWRSGDASGVVQGGGVRLWRRAADGSLRLVREIGTHDYSG